MFAFELQEIDECAVHYDYTSPLTISKVADDVRLSTSIYAEPKLDHRYLYSFEHKLGMKRMPRTTSMAPRMTGWRPRIHILQA